MVVAGLALAATPAERLPFALIVVLALLWSLAPLAAAIGGTATHRRRPPTCTDPARRGTVTTVVRLGDEPAEIAGSTVALARRCGPVVIATVRREVPELLRDLADRVHQADSIDVAIRTAAAAADTDAVLLVSARAVPNPEACARAAGLLDEMVGWVVGRSVPVNDDGYAPDRREAIGASLRHLARSSGLALWENDATLVRTDLLADHPIDPGRPWGRFLRARQAEGTWGVTTTELLSRRATPVAAMSFWPDAVARQRAQAADLADAAVHQSGPARRQALLLLARELYAVPLAALAAAPALLGPGATLGTGPWRAVALVGAASALRWWSLRALLGLRAAPRSDLTAAMMHLPGSFAACDAALRRRLRPARDLSQPLAGIALVLTLAAGAALIGQDPTKSWSRVVAIGALVMLGAAWAVAVRLLSQQHWRRASHRVPLGLRATVDGARALVLDGSPSGLAVSGRLPIGRFRPGRPVQVVVELDDRSRITSRATVAARRRRGDQVVVLGLRLDPDAAFVDRWSAQLLVAGSGTARGLPRPIELEPAARRRRLADRVMVGAVAAVSVVVIASLTLVLVGYRPLVVRSGSMVPTYRAGDVVLVEQVPVAELRPGDVASLSYYPPLEESMTHRVRSVTRPPGGITVETRGDANRVSEVWTVTPDAVAGRVVASIPALGAPATMARAMAGPAVLMAALAAVAVWVARRRVRSSPAEPRAVSPAG